MRRFLLRLWSFLRPRHAEGELAREIDAHLRLLEDDFVARGMTPAAARVAARRAFGRPDEAKELHRESRSFALLDRWRLDMKLGVRMLVKHRGLSLVGGFAMAVAIALGATSFEVLTELVDPALPFPGGDRIVSLREIGIERESRERVLASELLAPDTELTTVAEIGAYRSTRANLVSGRAAPEPVKVAEMTPSGFSITRVPPDLGRPLVRGDEAEGAPAVVVIGYQPWRARFGADPDIVGKTLDLGGEPRRVVGVMPEGFGFPYDQGFWLPLRASRLESRRSDAPALHLFARLRDGATIEQAEAELTAHAKHSAGASSNARVGMWVIPYTREHVDLRTPRAVRLMTMGQLLVGALSFVVAVNLAILFYARTVTRLGEIAVRSALGASRGRILTQLFIEALALALAGAAAGLVLTRLVLELLQSLGRGGGVPFWIRFDLSPATVFYAAGLALVAAAIMGVLPGLKATERRLAASLQDLSGRTTRLGAVWTTLVVGQVAVAVAVLPLAVYASANMLRTELGGVGFAAEKFVVATVFTSDDGEEIDPARVRERQAALISLLEAEPGVETVAFSSSVPGFSGSRWIELEEGTSLRAPPVLGLSTMHVEPALFEKYGVGMIAGRGFIAGDGASAHAIVNESFARDVLGDRSAVGVRFRDAGAGRPDPDGAAGEGPWYEIVGVVRDFPAFSPDPLSDGEPTIYYAAEPGRVHPFVLSIRFDRDVPPGITERIREIGAEVDRGLQLRRVVPLSQYYDEVRTIWRYTAWGIAAVTASVLLLSAAGIYALMSFTVSRRTREIGIRTALGATKGRLLVAIFGRALRQIGAGLLAGSALSGAAFAAADFGLQRSAALLVSVAAIMIVVGLLAALGPARRGLRVQPTEALRVEG